MNTELFNRYLEENPFESISEVVFKVLRRQILTWEIRPGTKLNVARIANTLNISRTPVRQAIDRLFKMGIVQTIPGKTGYYVFNMSRKDMEDLFRVRKLIEGEAAYLCAVKNSVIDKGRLQGLALEFEQIFKSRSYDKLTSVDVTFHELLVQGANNKYLTKMYQCLREMLYFNSYRMAYVLQHYSVDEDLISLAGQHFAIYKAIEIGLPEMARDALYAHLDSCISYARRHVTY